MTLKETLLRSRAAGRPLKIRENFEKPKGQMEILTAAELRKRSKDGPPKKRPVEPKLPASAALPLKKGVISNDKDSNQ